MQPRLCLFCYKTFSNSFNLKQHVVNVHTVGQGLQCHLCHKTVKNKWYLRKHHVTAHGAPLKRGKHAANNNSSIGAGCSSTTVINERQMMRYSGSSSMSGQQRDDCGNDAMEYRDYLPISSPSRRQRQQQQQQCFTQHFMDEVVEGSAYQSYSDGSLVTGTTQASALPVCVSTSTAAASSVAISDSKGGISNNSVGLAATSVNSAIYSSRSTAAAVKSKNQILDGDSSLLSNHQEAPHHHSRNQLA